MPGSIKLTAPDAMARGSINVETVERHNGGLCLSLHQPSTGAHVFAVLAPDARRTLARAIAPGEARPTSQPKLTARLKRGLSWVASAATGDFESLSGERGTGAFSGTSEPEVSEAIDWLRNLTRP